MIELEAVKKLLPKHQRSLITQEYLDKLEASITDPDIANTFKDNFITYLNVLTTGKYKMDDYISAVKYVSFKLIGYSNIDAYAATFPERFARLKKNKQVQIDAYVSMYNKNKLVIQIYEQTMVPSYVLNAPLHQEALNELADMIHDPHIRGMAKVKACEAILNYTKQPEIIKGELTIGVDQTNTVNELKDVITKLATAQKEAVEKNYKSLKDVTEDGILEVEVEDVTEGN